jgi:putative membrane protein
MGRYVSDQRTPQSVYGQGDEPDPRFSLANERTALAWMRSALGA